MGDFAVINPATGTEIARVPDMGASAAQAAIAAAQSALKAWKARTGKERAQVLRRWFDLVTSATDELAAIITAESGKPLAEAAGEVAYGAAFIEWFAEEAKRIYGETIPATKPGQRLMVLREPIGVVAAITPWNFPLAMITRKVAPALAAGCTIVLKPAKETPLTALKLAELAYQAGVPRDCFAVVTAANSRAIGQVMTDSPIVRKLTFTGSTAVGKTLMAASAGTMKKLSLELGGNAPFIVFDDADLDRAVAGAIAAKFRNAGQTCVCANRILVQTGVYEAFAEKFCAAVAALPVGDGADARTQIGPLIGQGGVDKSDAHVRDALAKGARAMLGGTPLERAGYFYAPTVLRDVPVTADVAREETFGPVAPLFRFDTEAEAIAMANDSEFGLAAYAYTRDLSRAYRVIEALEYGIVGLNEGIISTEVAPFGGVKESGLGREGSRHGIEDFLELKYACIGLEGTP
ncbi:Succinate-semialdehyde dehydrogenase [NADP(+)] GabD [Aquimixticola soesokkakensis]|uniref:Succinate-semialdehyde dehydrogenase [NADP(+)] GabD n=1 Tax=Aquimixticola soesokkakensis TaxID=1519096 RepID=A0A1Y5RZM1_9RHOB|nr:NAD-dependent succinate-semialdehyde dehydrogenase [Aquimixticola soesokkakensis]SLN28164.1 Succinate-semialdehyde dehydrogenase [NADP(+)] GabD [Aquimixticola soesokkakensis]